MDLIIRNAALWQNKQLRRADLALPAARSWRSKRRA
jgi:hypothetical protein